MDESSKSCCRVCLKGGANVPIFGEENITVYEKLSVCLGEQIKDMLGYPRHICSLCQITLNIVCQFIGQIKESHTLLANGWCEGMVKSSDHVFEIDYPIIKQEKLDETECHDPILFLGKDIKIDRIKLEAPALDDKDYNCKILIGKEEISKTRRHKITNKLKIENNIKKNSSKEELWREAVLKDSEVKEQEYFTCSICFKTFPGQRHLRRHIRSQHMPEVLQRKLNKVKLLRETTSKHDDEKQETNTSILCPTCGQVFETSNKYHKHKASHSKGEHICTVCKKKFEQQYNLRRHMIRIHMPEDKRHKCLECKKSFGLAHDLKLHMDKTHLRKPKPVYKCDQCPTTFNSKVCLVIHKRSKHTGERPDICDVCGASFYHIIYLREHMRLHTGEMPYKCIICGKGHAQRGNMKSHLRIHHVSELTEEQLKTIRPSYLKRMKK